MGRLPRAWAVGALALTLAACGSSPVRGTAGSRVKDLEDPAAPSSILDLTSQPEDVGKLVATTKDLYVDAVRVYSLRRDDQVQATLQISRFNAKARPKDDAFRKGIITELGGNDGTPTTVGGDTVYITQGKSQKVAVWFRAKDFFVLTTREDYDQPRALLREALQIGQTS